MLHLTKLAVGARDVGQLQAFQAERAETNPPLRHRTRNFPRRAPDVVAGGSMYWVVNGAMLVRQRILDIIDDTWDDGRRCAGLLLDPALILVAGRPVKPFQGWRYLKPQDAPDDLTPRLAGTGGRSLPPELHRELRALCLL